MDFENLQRELFERKLKMGEYFKRTFEVLKVFMKENVLWVMFFIMVNAGWLFLGVINSMFMSKISIFEYIGIFTIRQVLIPIFVNIFSAVVITNVAKKIENDEENYKFKNIFLKFVKYTAIYVSITFILGFVGDNVIFKTGNNQILMIILSAISGITSFLWLIIVLNALYFVQTYYTKDMKIMDALKYNLKLSKGNRLRILIPIIILGFMEARIMVPFFNGFFISHNVPLPVVCGISIFSGIILSCIRSFATVMEVIIFFNVEYDYLKKQNKNLK